MIRAIVEAGHAITLAGEITLAQPLASGALVAVALQQPGFAERTLQIQTASHATLPDATERFVRHLIQALSAGVAATPLSARRVHPGRVAGRPAVRQPCREIPVSWMTRSHTATSSSMRRVA